MSDQAPGRLPGHLQLTDLDIALVPGDAQHPVWPMVQGLRLRISAPGLQALAQGLIAEADRRAPVGLRLNDARVGPEGVDLFLRVEKSIFRSDVALRLALSAPGGDLLRIELTQAEMPSWVPLDMLLDAAVRYGGGAIRRDPDNRRALLLDPAALLARFVPGRFAPGHWNVATTADGIDLRFRETAATA